MPATLRDVAELAGVSTKTASNVVNHRPYVTPETRQKVLDAIATLGYRPNRSAQALRTRRARALAVIIPDIQNDFFTSVVRGVEDAAYRAGYMLFLCDVEDDTHREAQYTQLLNVGTIAGLILCTADEATLSQRLALLQADNIPVVAIDRLPPCKNMDAVLVENAEGSHEAVSHLIACGHQRIGVLAGPEGLTPGRERLAGYIEALQDHNLPVVGELIRRTDFKIESARQATHDLLALPDRPTALLVCSGMMSLGTIQAIRERGLRLPDDLALIIFDDPIWSRILDPPISTVAQPAYDMGRLATELLLRRLAQPDAPPRLVRLATHFICRQSCCRTEANRRIAPVAVSASRRMPM